MVERLDNVEVAGRKSKSLEEHKYLPHNSSQLIQAGDDVSESAQSDLARQYRTLTEYDKKRHDGVKFFVEALRRLEERGILKPVGSDKQGTQHYMIFGLRYPKDDDMEKGQIKVDIFDVFNYVGATYDLHHY